MDERMLFLALMVLVALGMYLGLFGLLLAVLLFFLFLCIKGTFSAGGPSCKAVSPAVGYWSETTEEGTLYRGPLANGSVLATYGHGQVWKGCSLTAKGVIGTYGQRKVYRGTRLIGRYQNGNLYWGKEISDAYLVGRYENGKIYGGVDGMDVIGRYTGNEDGGAAAALLFLFQTTGIKTTSKLVV